MPAKQRRNYGKVRATVSAIAQERIKILLSEARNNLDDNPALSRRYTELARKISMRTKVRIPTAEKRYICRGCGLPLVPGKNARVRILPGNPRIVITCLVCGAFRRYPFSKGSP